MQLPARLRAGEPVLRVLLLVGAAVLYLYGLDRSGWGNAFYAAAAQAGAHSWSALFFGSSDVGNTITVDKPPAALWVMGLSVRLFGLSSWSLLVPQALMGVAAVALLAAAVRRVLGPWPGLLAGALFALTPVVTLLFRYDNPDALMTLLLVAAAWTTVRAVEDGRIRWTVLTGALVGLAFLAKSLQAFLVLPALVAVVLLAVPGTRRRRLTHLLAGGAALAVAGGWWLLALVLIPRADRPWVGGTTSDSALGLAVGYNGLGRLFGEVAPGGVLLVHGGSPWRLFGSAGDQVAWLLPAALVALVAGLALVRRRPPADPVRASLILWGAWLVVGGLVLSTMQGIWHAYYTAELAPAVCALVAIGGTLLWRRRSAGAVAVLAAGSLLTTLWGVFLVDRRLGTGAPLGVAVLVLGVVAVGLLAGRRDASGRRRPARAALAALLLAALLGPATWSWATALRPHFGSSINAGPVGGRLLPPRIRQAPPATTAVLTMLRRDSDDWRWAAATVGNRAGRLQLALGRPVMPLGGFGGNDPFPTLAVFRSDVAQHRVHWYLAGAHGRGPAAQIDAWVRRHGRPVHIGRTTLYDLSALSTARLPADRA